MAKLFANKINLDNLPDPVKPVATVQQGGSNVSKDQKDIPLNVPNNTSGIGDTKLFPRTISLKDRLKQGFLGTTKHLPEYIVSDVNTGYITINKKQIVQPKKSPVDIKKVEIGSRTFDPKTVINKIEPGDRTVDPKIQITKIKPGDRITDPNTQVKQLVPGERTTDPKTKIDPITQGDRTTDPQLNIKPVRTGDRTTDPNLDINPVVQGDRTRDPKLKIDPVKVGDRTTNPKIKIIKSKPGSLATNPKIKISKVKPGDRTTDPYTPILNIIQGDKTTDPKLAIKKPTQGDAVRTEYTGRGYFNGITPNLAYRFEPFSQIDNKHKFTQQPRYLFFNIFSTYPSDGDVPLTGDTAGGNEYSDGFRYVDLRSGLNVQQITNGVGGQTTLRGSSANKKALPGDARYVENNGPFGGSLSKTTQPGGGASFYNQNEKYLLVNNQQDSPLKQSAQDENIRLLTNTPTLETNTYTEATKTTTNKFVEIIPNQEGDPNLPGGYATLGYDKIRERAKEPSKYKTRDFTVSDAEPTLAYYRTRLGMPETGADTINKSVNATANDFVVVKLQSTRDGSTLQFRSYIKSFSETYSPTYTDVNYIGRPDTLKVFKGSTRQISLGFLVPIMSDDESKVVYQKLNKLVQIGAMGKKTSAVYMQGPSLKLTVGGWCKNTPVVVGSIKYDTNPSEYTWDIMHEVPQVVDVSMDFTALSDNTGAGFYSDGTFIQYGA